MPTGLGCLDDLPRVTLAHTPTPIEAMDNLQRRLGVRSRLFVKRDDCTGLVLGGNKIRQLEFYVGQAMASSADTLLITGAVQSNFVRSVAGAASKLGLDCHVQLEERVADPDASYRVSGNVLLDRLLGATLHSYPVGEDEAGADRRLAEIAAGLEAEGRRPYVIPLGPDHPPWGALGYVVAAREILRQVADACVPIDEVVIASGSGNSHAGLLFGLRALGSSLRVTGVCVRRPAGAQFERIRNHCGRIADLVGIAPVVTDGDIHLDDAFLAPGYGMISDAVIEVMQWAARDEGLILDPVYTAKSMAGFLRRAAEPPSSAAGHRGMLFVHTGGQPALFAYEESLTRALRSSEASRSLTRRTGSPGPAATRRPS